MCRYLKLKSKKYCLKMCFCRTRCCCIIMDSLLPILVYFYKWNFSSISPVFLILHTHTHMQGREMYTWHISKNVSVLLASYGFVFSLNIQLGAPAGFYDSAVISWRSTGTPGVWWGLVKIARRRETPVTLGHWSSVLTSMGDFWFSLITLSA